MKKNGKEYNITLLIILLLDKQLMIYNQNLYIQYIHLHQNLIIKKEMLKLVF